MVFEGFMMFFDGFVVMFDGFTVVCLMVLWCFLRV